MTPVDEEPRNPHCYPRGCCPGFHLAVTATARRAALLQCLAVEARLVAEHCRWMVRHVATLGADQTHREEMWSAPRSRSGWNLC
jgi:hypothetical protein